MNAKMIRWTIINAILLGFLSPGTGWTHPTELLDDPHEHETPTLPASNTSNIKLIGKVSVNQDFDERVSDVAVMGNFAYVGAFSIAQKNCQKGGVYVIDIFDPKRPKQTGFIRIGNNSSFVGEGVQALKLNTAKFKGDLLIVSAEACSPNIIPAGASGGMTLVDIRNPQNPQILAEGVGDFSPAGDAYTPAGIAHSAHSVFAWTQVVNNTEKAFAAIVDIGDTGIDIMDITDPRNPVMINTDFKAAEKFPQIVQTYSKILKEIFAHDLTVKDINGKKIMLLSNWDSGYVVLDVTDPVNIKLVAPAFLQMMAAGVRIGGEKTKPCQVVRTGPASFRIVLTQGLNRQIRRMCSALGWRVQALRRVRIMHIRLGALPTGKWRDLTEAEVRPLLAAAVTRTASG